jgi:hypothetical protein
MEYRYWGHYTDAEGDPVALDAHMRAHAHVEDHIRRLKVSGLERFPFTDPNANRTWLAVVCFAADLVRAPLLCLAGHWVEDIVQLRNTVGVWWRGTLLISLPI